MQVSLYTVDVFTRQPFGGAQVAVLPDAAGVPVAQMQRIASELNLPTSVFLTAGRAAESWHIRVFTPDEEVDFAAHAILAAGHALALDGHLPASGEVELLHAFGSVRTRVEPQADGTVFVQFSRTVHPVIDRFVPSPEELAGILSLPRRELVQRDLQPLLVACERPYLMVPVHRMEAVRQARFDAGAWARSHAPAMLAQELMLFSRQCESTQADFHTRLLGPAIGPREDPPVGAALPAFAAYLAAQPTVRPGTHTLTVERGLDATRKSLLQAEFDKRVQRGLALRVGGHAVRMFSGHFSLPR
ncbi:MAG TPA: PhzF family phenazine biosynthesis protein [Gammaproteobacteria bacterium]|uniref:PhzF family phenazine biosynthesis protein n=1 Tax=Immundisolibacter sp. TaxID=1934948 RepID=UPI000E979710|nr:PhzF family phenazine biosynthesis protein [Gammaproteobacteria bacterium]HCZ49741.1 PhzF family phenazine biosynthesis protein [Gammaproteobacteria bacterium]MCH79179.1 PhzF family phenazine biosynthesis protein [Gammaproteobacteria bacterium]